jgi:methionyl-tRNA formyltransferase
MKAIFLGRKPAASAALRHLIERGIEVVAVMAPPASDAEFERPWLCDSARELGIPVVSDEVLYNKLATRAPESLAGMDLHDIDLVLSFLFWRRIRRPLIDLPRVGCFNFHPAPLPNFRGRRGYNYAILEGCAEYGASVHWVADGLDTGDIVEVRMLPIAPEETAVSLEQKTMKLLLDMFRDFIHRALAGGQIPRTPQGPGRSATKQQMREQACIGPDDDAELIARKVRAFWYPPCSGATIELGGRRYTLVDDVILADVGRLLHRNRNPQQ